MSNLEVKASFCIIQITRIGDLLQTLKAARDFKATYPNVELTLVAREQFSKEITFLLKETFSKIIAINFKDDFLKSNGLKELNSKIKNFIENINTTKYDVVINFSYSKTSQYIMSFINAKDRIGPYINEKNKLIVRDNWSKYLLTTVLDGPLNPYNLVDIYKESLGVETNIESVRRNILKTKSRIKISIHPFASAKRKYFKPEKWIEIIYKLTKMDTRINIYILGSKEDYSQSQVIMNSQVLQKEKNRIKNYCSKTNIKETFEILKKSDLLLAHDSMVSHLNTFTDTPSIIFSQGSARALETSPYKLGNIVITPKINCYPCMPGKVCNNYLCHKSISDSAISKLVLNYISENEILNAIPDLYLSGMDIFETIQTSTRKIRLKKINERLLNIKEVFDIFYSISWQYNNSEKEEIISFPKLNNQSYKELVAFLGPIEQVFGLSEFGKKYCIYILEELGSKKPSIKSIKTFSAKIEEIDLLLDKIMVTYPILRPPINFFKLDRNQMNNSSLVDLTENMFNSYESMSSFISILFELADKTISEYMAQNKIKTSKLRNQV